jgi:hypothetical protein
MLVGQVGQVLLFGQIGQVQLVNQVGQLQLLGQVGQVQLVDQLACFIWRVESDKAGRQLIFHQYNRMGV